MWFDGGIQERCHFLFLGIVSLMLMKHFEKSPQVEGTEGVYEAQVGDESGEQLSTAELGFSMQERCHFRSFQISKVRTGPKGPKGPKGVSQLRSKACCLGQGVFTVSFRNKDLCEVCTKGASIRTSHGIWRSESILLGASNGFNRDFQDVPRDTDFWFL